MTEPTSNKKFKPNIEGANWTSFRSLYSNLPSISTGNQFTNDYIQFLSEKILNKMYSSSCDSPNNEQYTWGTFCQNNKMHCFDMKGYTYTKDKKTITKLGYYDALSKFINKELFDSGTTWSTNIDNNNPLHCTSLYNFKPDLSILVNELIDNYLKTDDPTYPIVPPPWPASGNPNLSPTNTNITKYSNDVTTILMTYIKCLSNPGGKGTAKQLADGSTNQLFEQFKTLYRYQNRIEQLITQMQTFALITAGNKRILDTDPGYPYKESQLVPKLFVDEDYMSNLLTTIINFNDELNQPYGASHFAAKTAITQIQDQIKTSPNSYTETFITAAYNPKLTQTSLSTSIKMPIKKDYSPDLTKLQWYGQSKDFKTNTLQKFSQYSKALSDLMFTYFLEVINNKKTTGTTINLDNYIKLLLAKQELNSTINNLSLYSNAELVQEPSSVCTGSYCTIRQCTHEKTTCQVMTCGWESSTLTTWFTNTIDSKLKTTDNTNIIIYTQSLAKTLLAGTTPSTLCQALADVVNNEFQQYSPPSSKTTNLSNLKSYDDLVAIALFEYMVSYVYT